MWIGSLVLQYVHESTDKVREEIIGERGGERERDESVVGRIGRFKATKGGEERSG